MRNQPPSARVSLPCGAAPEAVYDLLADLSTHLEWGGARQRRDFRLTSLDAPAGRATTGTAFTSTGTIPMSGRHWEDRSTVTAAEGPHVFEFITEARNGGARGMRAGYRHRYEITPQGGGCRVAYTITELEVTRPMPRMAWPVIRELTWRIGIPLLCRRGVRNLVRQAERTELRPAADRAV